jgi:hypothetical protein
MGYQLILFFLITALLILFVRRVDEGFTNASIPGLRGVDEGQRQFNDFSALINLANPQIPLSPNNAVAVQQATATPTYSGGLPGEFQMTGVTNAYQIPASQPDSIRIAQETCEKVKTTDCGAFDNPSFAMNCGVSYDMEGRNSKGEPHMGGMYLSASDRERQVSEARAMGTSEKRIRYTPTVGSAQKSKFTVTKAQCNSMREQLACEQQKALGSNNCAQCYTSGEFNRIDPEVPRILPKLVFLTNATAVAITLANNTILRPAVTPGTPVVMEDIAIREGEQTRLEITGNPADLYFCGYIAGQTTTGEFILDIARLIQTDTVTQQRPRLMGSRQVNTTSCSVMRPGVGKNIMNLTMVMPFTLLTVNEEDAQLCSNGPFITKPDSATFLESDPCFAKGSGPGAYGLPCLQQLFVSMGGTVQGTGYPSTQEKARSIMFNGAVPRSLTDIGQYLYDMNVQAATGRDPTGNSLTLEEWNSASMFATGVAITSPCEVAIRGTGPISDDCLQYLYLNKGATNNVGATYTNGSQYAGENGQYCTSDGRLNPAKPEAAAKARAIGTIAGVQQLYDTAHRTAHNNALPNEQRQEAIRDCYGDTLRPRDAEVYVVGPGYDHSREEAAGVCAKYGGQVATKADVEGAWRAGANWCFTGWVSDQEQAVYPINEQLIQGCADRPMVATWTPPYKKAGVTCVGPKPARSAVQEGVIKPFNIPKNIWNQRDIV